MNTHAIYGLFRTGRPREILYVGSSLEANLVARLEQHRAGMCKTTAKMAIRHSVPLSELRIHVLRLWQGGIEPSPERRIMRLVRAFGMGRWSHPHAFTSEEGMRGSRVGGRVSSELGVGIHTPGGWPG